MTDKFSLKDHLFNKEKVAHLAGLVRSTHTDFDDEAFIANVLREFPHLELKDRIKHIREMLHEHLPSEYKEALAILLRALPPELDPLNSDDDYGDFIYAPLNDFVAVYGCTQEHFQESLDALEQMTKRFSCEDAIRYFIINFEKETMQRMGEWSTSNNYHVRRLASEGSRPLLPWSARVHLDSAKVIAKILDNLWYDSTRYVVRSVANHLNDISKQDALLVIKTLKRWQKENKMSNKQKEGELAYLIRHSLRTLMKQGHEGAMQLLGYEAEHGVVVSNSNIAQKRIVMGDPVEFSLNVQAGKDVKVLIDYTMYFASKSGKERKKVYRLKDTHLKVGEKAILKKRHPLRANMSTIKLYKGAHRITLQINGVESDSVDFVIT